MQEVSNVPKSLKISYREKNKPKHFIKLPLSESLARTKREKSRGLKPQAGEKGKHFGN